MATYSFNFKPLTAPDTAVSAQLPDVAPVNHIPEPQPRKPEDFPATPAGAARMIWCTCCEKNEAYYFGRVVRWSRQLDELGVKGDRFVFIDGKIVVPPPKIDVEWVEQPFLGRQSTSVFPGWKRSFGEALRKSLNYDLALHVENDFLISNREKFLNFVNRMGIFTSWDARYRMIEPSLMILNDRETRARIAAAYATDEDYREKELFENRLQILASWNFVFKSYRLEGQTLSPALQALFDGFGQALS